ncbi:MAG: AI-2E family transporter, partial [Synechococcus sp.]|nr:AI-2E family transporter [Synechococcus sp.]
MKLPQWIGLAALTAACLLIWSLRDVLIHLFAAIVLAMALCTLVGSLRDRWPMPRPWALLICLLGVLLVIGIGLAVLVPPFLSQFRELLLQLPQAWAELQQIAIAT